MPRALLLFLLYLSLAQAQRCGCQECTDEVLNRDAPTLYGDQVFTCEQRISFLETSFEQTEEEACLQVANVEFRTICGNECNPLRCDGRAPDFITPSPTVAPLDVELEPETELFCYPSYDDRKRWTGVWGQNFIVEVKEDSATCGPGSNFFDRSLVDIQNNELKLQFKLVNGRWSGSEVRVVLPTEDMPFRYGSYTFSVKSVQHRKLAGTLVNDYLPPSLVLGFFTWDDTERFELRENYNHEVDVEITRWNRTDGTDANFLLQPPELPQFQRFYSGGGPGLFNQTGFWEFTWLPNVVTWSTTAGPGMTHSYSTSDAQLYGLEDRIQCLPANVEVRMNLWNTLGAVTPMEMSEDELVEVVIDNFVYIPGDISFVEDGGACSKDCQCSSRSSCVEGTCEERETAAPTASPPSGGLPLSVQASISISACLALIWLVAD